MKRILILCLAALLFASCASTNPDLYNWGGKGKQKGETMYESLTYNYYKSRTPKSLCELLCLYESMTSKYDGTTGMPAPGICAEYAYLLMQPETAATFADNATNAQKRIFGSADFVVLFKEKGNMMLQKEMEYYPESARLIAPLFERYKDKK